MSSRTLGVLLIAIALAVNEWTVGRFLGLYDGLDVPSLRGIILSFQLLLAASGLWLLRSKRRIHRGYVILVPIFALVPVIAAEFVLRIVFDRSRNPLRATAPRLGWQTVANTNFSFVHPAFGPVTVKTGPHGFRRWDSRPGGVRVFVIGDSYTEAAQVSPGQAWYDVITELDTTLRIFAYGTGGYGTLQEYMVLDRHIDSIRPQLVIWQLSANDIVNNDHFLETQSPIGTRMVRPFYENGKIVERFAGSGPGLKYSRLVRFINARLAMAGGYGFAAGSVDEIGRQYPHELTRSMLTTRALMKLARKRTVETQIAAFVSEGSAWSDSLLHSAATESGWIFVAGVRDSVAAANARGVRTDGMPRDGHWNAAGHEIAGRVVAQQLFGLFRKHH